jgi:5-methyltetrahydropteroyltriglutamate--homocysteine methyltransferase
MKRSTDRIRTTHTGSMPRPPQIFEMMQARAAGKRVDAQAFESALGAQVGEIVRRQVEAGIDVVNDGECSKVSFNNYVAERLSGFEGRVPAGGMAAPTGPIGIGGRDFLGFRDYYEGVLQHNPFAHVIRIPPQVCVGPVRYVGQAQVQRDIANLKRAMAAANADEGFLPALSPIPSMRNEHYASEEEFCLAFGEALREEYRAILDAGLLLQIDDPRMVSSWDAMNDTSLADYRKWMEKRVALLNHALRGLPAERIRYHTCYGVNFGPRLSDLQLEDVADILFRIEAGAYSFEAANPRHEHEWKIWGNAKLPKDKLLIPGVISHSTVLVEHPELVAERIVKYAKLVGKERVIAGSDCGFATFASSKEVHPSIVWAKMQAMTEGARMASKELWKAGSKKAGKTAKKKTAARAKK